MEVKSCEEYLRLSPLGSRPPFLTRDSTVLSILRQVHSPMEANIPLHLRLFARYLGTCSEVWLHVDLKSVFARLTWITRLSPSLIELRKAFEHRHFQHGAL